MARDLPNPDAWPYVVGNVHYHWRKPQALVKVAGGWWAVDAETGEEAWGPRPRTAARALEDKLGQRIPSEDLAGSSAEGYVVGVDELELPDGPDGYQDSQGNQGRTDRP